MANYQVVNVETVEVKGTGRKPTNYSSGLCSEYVVLLPSNKAYFLGRELFTSFSGGKISLAEANNLSYVEPVGDWFYTGKVNGMSTPNKLIARRLAETSILICKDQYGSTLNFIKEV